MSDTITPRPPMTSTGPAYSTAHYVCTVCGYTRKLPSDGKPDERPWCAHGDNYSWHPPVTAEEDVPEHMRWVQMEYAEVRVGEPHSNGEAWGEDGED